MYLFLIFICMFFHVLSDFTLQGWLATAKSKKYWEENFNSDKYKHDYIMALFAHAFSWSFMIHIPIVFALNSYYMLNYNLICFTIIVNTLIHALVDDWKANKGWTNLIQDQTIHIVQIVLTVIFIYHFS